MCYQESRWHAICNHTIQAKVECPKQCAKYGAIDCVETQLAAYCHACRRHVDSQGNNATNRNTLSSNSRLSHRPSNKRASTLPGNLHSFEIDRSAAVSPTLSVSSQLSSGSSLWTASGSSLGKKRLTTAASTGDLRGETGLGRKASRRAIVSVFVQEQHEGLKERAEEDMRAFRNVSNARPEVKSPITEKPAPSLHIPEDAIATLPSATPVTVNTITSDGRSSQATTPPVTKTTILGCVASPPASTAPTTPEAPPSVSATVEQQSLETLPVVATSGLGSALTDLRKSLRKTGSSSRLLSNKLPYFLQHKNRSTQEAVVITTMAPPISPASSLRMSKSNWVLSEDMDKSERANSLRSDRDWRGTSSSSMMAKSRPVAPAGRSFKPGTKKELIDIHDPGWLAKHGLKWDTHGLGIVSAAV